MIEGVPVRELVSYFFMILGLVFLMGSAIGMLRLPDFYSRIHASGNSETLGMLSVFVGLAVYHGFNVTSAKIFAVAMFVFLGNPIGSHILAKAAYKTGHPVWTRKRAKELEELEDGEEAEANADIHR